LLLLLLLLGEPAVTLLLLLPPLVVAWSALLCRIGRCGCCELLLLLLLLPVTLLAETVILREPRLEAPPTDGAAPAPLATPTEVCSAGGVHGWDGGRRDCCSCCCCCCCCCESVACEDKEDDVDAGPPPKADVALTTEMSNEASLEETVRAVAVAAAVWLSSESESVTCADGAPLAPLPMPPPLLLLPLL